MASKSSQPARYRKGSEIQVGDMVAVKWDGMRPVEFSKVVSVELVDAATLGQRGGRQHRATLANGNTKTATGAEYVEGSY